MIILVRGSLMHSCCHEWKTKKTKSSHIEIMHTLNTNMQLTTRWPKISQCLE